ncbi:hypothetical protein [Niveispirillum sp. KHB5.9]|uniref:hypothetical protein n=1 Tax=Niveispirillum sp. KHB5.9 TaxID=3400269 RepID=UPI003A894F0C
MGNLDLGISEIFHAQNIDKPLTPASCFQCLVVCHDDQHRLSMKEVDSLLCRRHTARAAGKSVCHP